MSEQVARREMQKMAVGALYSALTYLDMGEEIDVKLAIESGCGLPYGDAPVFVKEIVIAVLRHYEEAVNRFQSHMVKWSFARLNRVEQAILLLAYAHFFYVEPGIEKAIPISVAVALSKEYLDATDYRFVNAVLDNVLVKQDGK